MIRWKTPSLTLEDIERQIGVEVAKLVDGVTKMEHLPTQVTGKGARQGSRVPAQDLPGDER
jgi:(p)ppGpp synthase/HD superfamily hydrolase